MTIENAYDFIAFKMRVEQLNVLSLQQKDAYVPCYLLSSRRVPSGSEHTAMIFGVALRGDEQQRAGSNRGAGRLQRAPRWQVVIRSLVLHPNYSEATCMKSIQGRPMSTPARYDTFQEQDTGD
jgi:hypothetical protein